jgi:hypothetical protein
MGNIEFRDPAGLDSAAELAATRNPAVRKWATGPDLIID